MRGRLATGAGLGALAATESEDAEAIFLGTGARNASHDMLGMAWTMERRGVNRDEIWQKTGWGRGTDGHWRFEMDDRELFAPVPEVIKQGQKPGGKWEGREAWYRDDEGAVTAKRPLGYDFNGKRIGWNLSPRNLQNLTGGDQLIENYPALAAIDIPNTRIPEPAIMKSGNGGSMYGVGEGYLYADGPDHTYLAPPTPSWSQEQHQYYGSGAYENPPTMKINQLYEPVPSSPAGADEMLEGALGTYRGVAVHELQHAIQDLEGWAQGSPVDGGKESARKSAYWEDRLLWDGGESAREVDPLIDEYDKLVQKWTDLDREIAGDFEDAPEELLNRYQKVDEELEFLKLRYPYVRKASVDRKLGEDESRKGIYISDMQAYRNTAGEVEARNAEKRRDMTPQERRENPPWKTADTPEYEQTTIGIAPRQDNRYRTEWQPQRERLVKENILRSTGLPEVRDLMRSGMAYESDAWNLVQPQLDLDRQTLEDNLDNYFQFAGGTPEQRTEMMMEAERINTSNNGRYSPYTGKATMAAAGAGGGVLATMAANLDSILPRGTANAVSDLGAVDSGIAAADTAVRAGQGLVNDIITGGTMVTNAVADEDYEPYEVDIDPGTEQGNTLAQGLMEDMGRLFEYKGIMGNAPSANEMIGDGIDLYNEHVSPLLNDRVEEGLGGAALLAASTPFIPGSRTIREAADIEFDREMDLMQRVKDPDSVNAMQLEVTPGPALLDDPIVSAEDLEGRGFVSGMSDTSRGDRSVITSANGVEMQTDRWGGQDYSRQAENADRGALWAADQGAITGFVNAANATMDLPGVTRSPIWMPYGMMGASTDYAHMTTDFMYPIALENMSKRDQRALDKRVREGAGNKKDYFRPQPDFPGMGKLEVEAWLREAGHRRKSFAKAIDEFRDDAGVNLSMARGALVDPDQLDPRLGNLKTIGVLNMDDMVANGPHPSYPVDINGGYLGRFAPGANLLDDFSPMRRPAGDRKVADDFKAVMEGRGHDLSAKKMPAAVGKAMAQGLIGKFDQETLDWLIKQGYIKS